MKAEDFLHSKAIESATCITNKATYYLKDLIILLNGYSRIQIEKDREDLINDIVGDESGSDVIDMIKNRQIILY